MILRVLSLCLKQQAIQRVQRVRQHETQSCRLQMIRNRSRSTQKKKVKGKGIDQLFRLAAVTGTIRILRGEGGVGGGSGPYSAWQEKIRKPSGIRKMNIGNSQLWRPAANLIPLGTQNPSGIRILEGREGWTGGSGPYSAWQCPSQNPSGITDLCKVL